MTQTLPIYVLEEHHQAFEVWFNSFEAESCFNGRMLIHIDEHADFGVPFLRMPIPEHNEIDKLHDFVYKNLTIGTFILPAIANGYFQYLEWLKPSDLSVENSSLYFINKLTEYPFVTKAKEFSPESTVLEYRKVEWSTVPNINNNYIIDICLDAFACHKLPICNDFILEISKEQFDYLNSDKLNPWFFRYGARIELNEKFGRYYFSLIDPWSRDAMVSSDEYFNLSMHNLKKFREYIFLLPNNPEMITVCKSFKSGYTPKIVGNELLNCVLDILSERFPSSYVV